jgi:hypothetical protein
MVGSLQAGDLSGALAEYRGAHDLFAQSESATTQAHLPPGWGAFLSGLVKLADDTRGGVQAAQRGDYAAVQTAAESVDSDTAALTSIDTAALSTDDYIAAQLARVRRLEEKANADLP